MILTDVGGRGGHQSGESHEDWDGGEHSCREEGASGSKEWQGPRRASRGETERREEEGRAGGVWADVLGADGYTRRQPQYGSLTRQPITEQTSFHRRMATPQTAVCMLSPFYAIICTCYKREIILHIILQHGMYHTRFAMQNVQAFYVGGAAKGMQL